MGMIRKSIGALCCATAAAMALFGSPAMAASQRDLDACNRASDLDVQIAGCTRALASGGLTSRAVPLNTLGNAWTRKGDYDRAIAYFDEAIRADPKYSYPYNGRGLAWARKGEYDRALADYDQAIRLQPKNAIPWNNRATLWTIKGEYDHAIADATEAIRIDSKFLIAYTYRGIAYLGKGEADRALADCDQAVRIDPKEAVGHLCLGQAHSAKGEYDRAVASYSEAIRLDPLDPEPLTGRGLVYEKIAEFAKARADFKAALGLSQRSETEKLAQDKARERLAILADAPAAATSVATVIASPAVTAVVASAAPASINDRRIALVIGNSAYQNVPALPNPERDATFVAETLKRTGFESVTVLINLRKEALITALRNFATQAESADWAVVYYAGHGMEVGGINYLVPTDARIAADRDIGFEAVPLEQVLNAAERAKKLRLVILDACRDNPFASQMKRTLTVASRSVTRGLAAVEPEAGTLVVYAAKDGETAIDGDGNNSPFALAFVKNLKTPGLEVRRLFDNVRDDVMDATARKQKPFSYGSISGRQDFYFVANK
jgi:Flp pilus assembly protein TadD